MSRFIFCLIAFLMVCNAHATKYCVVKSCNAGYYATSSVTSGATGKVYYTKCERCPGLPSASGGTQYGTTSVGKNMQSACTMPAGVSLKDSTGTYTFTSNCKY